MDYKEPKTRKELKGNKNKEINKFMLLRNIAI